LRYCSSVGDIAAGDMFPGRPLIFKMTTQILFVEDEDNLRGVLLDVASMNGYRAEGVATAEAALERLAGEAFDIVVTDVTLPGMSGLDLLPRLLRLQPRSVPIVITAYGTIDIAVEAMKRGASDFLTKPIALDNLLGVLRVAAERASAHRVPVACGDFSDKQIIATSPVMLRLFDSVNGVAPFNTTVLITGETGTGKELIARSIHQHSPRKARSLVTLNCAAIPEQLLEDELFGHVKGAFTGAQNAREGRFEQADGGTLFLDEIGEMSLVMQAKLLRVLQEREFEKLGSSRTIKVDVRVVAATSANLERRIEEGHFRADLYYRLNVVHLRVPPLRERAQDIQPLAEHLLTRFCTNSGLPVKSIDEQVWPVLTSYHWPGNVRQLQNAMERAATLSNVRTMIRLNDFPEEVRDMAFADAPPPSGAVVKPEVSHEGQNIKAIVSNVERNLLLQTLGKTGGNKTRAAKLLNMKRTTLVERLKRLQHDAVKTAGRRQER
jgi:DNA-binding NtrC family response regulator